MPPVVLIVELVKPISPPRIITWISLNSISKATQSNLAKASASQNCIAMAAAARVEKSASALRARFVFALYRKAMRPVPNAKLFPAQKANMCGKTGLNLWPISNLGESRIKPSPTPRGHATAQTGSGLIPQRLLRSQPKRT